MSRLFDADKSSVTAYCLSTSLNLTVAAPRSPCAFGPSMRHLSNNAYVDQLWPDRRTKSEAGPTFAFPSGVSRTILDNHSLCRPPHPAHGVYPGPLRCAQGRSQRKGERARHPLPQRGRGLSRLTWDRTLGPWVSCTS